MRPIKGPQAQCRGCQLLWHGCRHAADCMHDMQQIEEATGNIAADEQGAERTAADQMGSIVQEAEGRAAA